MAEPGGGIPRITDFNQYLQASGVQSGGPRSPAHPAMEQRREQITGQPAAGAAQPQQPQLRTSIAAPRPTEAESDALFRAEQKRRGVPETETEKTLATKGGVEEPPFYANPVSAVSMIGGPAAAAFRAAGRAGIPRLGYTLNSALGNATLGGSDILKWLGRKGFQKFGDLSGQLGGAVRGGFNETGSAMAQNPGAATLLNQAIARARAGQQAASPAAGGVPSAAPAQSLFDFAGSPFSARGANIGGVRPPVTPEAQMPGFLPDPRQMRLPGANPPSPVGAGTRFGGGVPGAPPQPMGTSPVPTGGLKPKAPMGGRELVTSIRAPQRAKAPAPNAPTPAGPGQPAPVSAAAPVEAAVPKPSADMDAFINANWNKMQSPYREAFVSKAQQYRQAAEAGDEAASNAIKSDLYDMVMRSTAGL